MTVGDSVIEYPLVTEKAMNAMDFSNAIQFVVSLDATKGQIASEIEDRYEFTVESVNTQVTPEGKKKAVVALEEDDAAEEIASRIGVF